MGVLYASLLLSYFMKEIQQKTQSTRDRSQEQHNIHHSKRTFFIDLTLNLTYLIVKLALLITLTVTFLTIDLPYFTNTNSYNRVQENLWLWEKEVIIEIRVVDSQICPVDFEDLVTYEWPGNIQGCYCQITIGLYQYLSILQGQCGQMQFNNGCQTIEAHQKMKFSYWIHGAHLCVRRLKNYNFYSSITNIVNPYNYPTKHCSPDYPYQIDLIELIPCPLTHLQNDTLLSELVQKLQFSYERQSDYPLVYFRIVEDNFCQELSADNVSPGRHSNYILQKKAKFQCTKRDQRTVNIDQQLQTELFQSNPKIKKLVESLPGYPAIDEHYKYKLGFVRYPSWKYLCRNSQQFSLLQAKQKMNLQNITPKMLICTYIILFCIAVGFISVLLYVIDHYTHLKAKYINGYLYLKDFEIKKLNNRSNLVRNRQSQMLKFIFSELFTLIPLITLIIYYSKIVEERLWYEQSLSCTSQPFISYLHDFLNFYSSTIIYLVTSIFINTAILIIASSHIAYRMCKGDLQLQPEQEQIRQQQTKTESSIDNEMKLIKTINFTEQNLIENSFFKNETKQNLQIYVIYKEEKQDFELSSEYSISERQ